MKDAAHERAAQFTPRDRAVLGVEAAQARVAFYRVDDDSPQAENARRMLANVLRWEERRRGRSVRLWRAIIETRASAIDEQDALLRLTDKMRHPLHWTGDCDVLYRSQEIEEDDARPASGYQTDVDWIRPDELDPGEQDRLDLDYPRRALTHVATRDDDPEFEAAHILDYVESLRRGSARLRGSLTVADEQRMIAQRGPLPESVTLTFWRYWQEVDFLAGIDEESARRRGELFGSTIVDFTGRPVGRVINITPDDGDMGEDGLWLHPGRYGGDKADALFDDYDLSPNVGGETERLADLLDRIAAELHKVASTLSYPY